MRQRVILVSIILLVIGLLLACGGPAQQDQQPAHPGQALLEDRCTRCHTLDRVTSASKTQEDWISTVDRMIERGAALDPGEREAVIEHLTETYGT